LEAVNTRYIHKAHRNFNRGPARKSSDNPTWYGGEATECQSHEVWGQSSGGQKSAAAEENLLF